MIIISILWIAGIFSFYIFGLFERPSSFNELGDFLAGVFAPVAFVWLILGYIQQGKQLEQNSTAINQQAQALAQQEVALKKQIEEFHSLVEIQERHQIDKIISCKPYFIFKKVECELKPKSIEISVTIENHGLGEGVEIYLMHDKCKSPLGNKINKLDINQNLEYTFQLNDECFVNSSSGDFISTLINNHYRDRLGNKYIKTHKITIFKQVLADNGKVCAYITEGTEL